MTDKTLKIARMERHLQNHPNDCQTVISLMEARSNQILYEDRIAMIPTKRRMAEIRRQMNEECSQ